MMTASERNAVLVLFEWLAKPGRISDEAAERAVRVLVDEAARCLPARPPSPFDAIRQRLAAADSDGAAQAVCRAMAAEEPRLLFIPQPYRRPFEEWKATRARQETPTP